MEPFESFLQSLKNHSVSIVGIGVSHKPLICLLAKHGIHVTAYDKKSRDSLEEFVTECESLGVNFVLGDNYLDDLQGDIVFKTPGMRGDLPAFCRIRQNGGIVTSEMQEFFRFCPCKIFAVTGSDGKTTTTTLISELLKQANFRVFLGGNIGTPLLPRLPEMSSSDFAVVELSSFQLSDMNFSGNVSVVTNVAPNHLDWHKGMDEYVAAKRNVFKFQNKDDVLVLNQDNEITKKYSDEAIGEVRFFSFRNSVTNGVFRDKDGMIHSVVMNMDSIILDSSDILLPGDHNIENYMAAICAVRDYVSVGTIQNVARTFRGVEHRMEFVRELNGVKWYNDSIATSPTRVIAGLKAQKQKIIMLAGGYDKKIPFDPMVPYILEKVKCILLVGATAEKINNCILSHPDFQASGLKIEILSSWQESILRAKEIALPGDIVSLSPACAAFDCFENFEKRGEYYKKMVHSF